ncbi:MAG: hypothetical protein JWQ78_455 [Sediminibacterium sp.]|nr:hypothetical protein [Sediminibacterium sp.]
MRFFRVWCICATGSIMVLSMGKLQAQLSASDSIARATSIYHSIRQYHAFLAPASALYNGPQYVEYTHTLRVGHPFFQSPDFSEGTILYDNILYEKVPLKYDLVKNKVVIPDVTGNLRVTLFNEKIATFNLLNHTFLHLPKDSAKNSVISGGFYDLLYNGRSVVLLKKETKKILEELNAYDGVKRSIEDMSDYYIKKNGVYYRVGSKGSVLAVLSDKKAAIRQLIRQKKFKFRGDRDNVLTSIVAFYDKN